MFSNLSVIHGFAMLSNATIRIVVFFESVFCLLVRDSVEGLRGHRDFTWLCDLDRGDDITM